MVLETKNLTVTAKGTRSSQVARVPFVRIKEKVLGTSYDLSIAFVSPKDARELNISRRGKDYVPNTLSFSFDKKSGEIVLCPAAIRKEYKKFEMTHYKYLIYLLIHSMLHLKGYAHGATMERREKQLLALFA